MKEKFKNSGKKIVTLAALVIMILIFIYIKKLFIYNIKENDLFFEVSIIEIVLAILELFSLIIGSIIIYFLTRKDNKIFKQKEIVEKLVDKLQKLLQEDYIVGINEQFIKCERIMLNIKYRKISNHISLLKSFSRKFDYFEMIDYVDKKMKEYKESICKMEEDSDFSEKSFNNLKRLINLIDDKLEEIIIKIYND